ncbi:MAG: hypothetical protein ACLRNA_10360 [Gemmiger formicilis]|uniref:hypothetical protein n=1 Tax=Gemmiger formicilis TaxID=745368 RepID=UPI003A2354FE
MRRAKPQQIICYAQRPCRHEHLSLIGMSYSASIGYGITTAVGIIDLLRILDDPLLAFVYDASTPSSASYAFAGWYLIEALALYGMFTGFSSRAGPAGVALLYIVYIIGYTITNMTAQTIPAIMTNDPRQR